MRLVDELALVIKASRQLLDLFAVLKVQVFDELAVLLAQYHQTLIDFELGLETFPPLLNQIHLLTQV